MDQGKDRKILVLLNPFGGAGAARTNWELVRPMFDDAAKSRIRYTLLETERRNHAFEYV
jgi:diacylglycerol kinase family enzyme